MNIQLKWLLRFSITLLIFIIIYLFWNLKQIWLPILISINKIVAPFLIAILIAYLLNPLVERLDNYRIKRTYAVLIIYSLFIGLVFIGLYKGVPVFVTESRELIENAPVFIEQYNSFMSRIESNLGTWPGPIQERFFDVMNTFEIKVDKSVKKFTNKAFGLVNLSILIALIPFITFYVIKDYQFLKGALFSVVPNKWKDMTMQFLKDIDKSLGSYIRGQLLLSLIVGVLSSLSFYFIGMEYSLLLGIIIGVMNIIPYFGPIIGSIPALIIAFAVSLKMVIYVIVIIIVIQFIEGNVIGPVVVGKTLKMHPLVVIFALLVGSEIGGIIGLILIVPVFAIIKIAFINIRQHFFHKKESILQ